jgi:hypothetical protein
MRIGCDERKLRVKVAFLIAPVEEPQVRCVIFQQEPQDVSFALWFSRKNLKIAGETGAGFEGCGRQCDGEGRKGFQI